MERPHRGRRIHGRQTCRYCFSMPRQISSKNKYQEEKDAKSREEHDNSLLCFISFVLFCLSTDPHQPGRYSKWGSVKVPPPPELKDVTVDPKTTALLLLDFNKQTCNAERRPRCVASIPKMKKLLDYARAKGILSVWNLPVQYLEISLRFSSNGNRSCRYIRT